MSRNDIRRMVLRVTAELARRKSYGLAKSAAHILSVIAQGECECLDEASASKLTTYGKNLGTSGGVSYWSFGNQVYTVNDEGCACPLQSMVEFRAALAEGQIDLQGVEQRGL